MIDEEFKHQTPQLANINRKWRIIEKQIVKNTPKNILGIYHVNF